MKTATFHKHISITMASALTCVVLMAGLFIGNIVYAEDETRQQLANLSQAFRDIVKDVGPAVVYISTEQTVKSNQQTPEQFREFFWR